MYLRMVRVTTIITKMWKEYIEWDSGSGKRRIERNQREPGLRGEEDEKVPDIRCSRIVYIRISNCFTVEFYENGRCGNPGGGSIHYILRWVPHVHKN